MRISELSGVAGVSVPTIKYYLREGLLPRGAPTARNQADYSRRHLQRLRLIRTLTEIGGLDLHAVRQVLQAIDDPRRSLHEVLGVAHHALGPTPSHQEPSEDVVAAQAEVDEFLAEHGWRVSQAAPARRALADALVALRRLGRNVGTEAFAPYAQAVYQLAAGEVGRVARAGPRDELVESLVVGTVVFEAVLTALRRLAQEHHSAIRLSP
ncbi:MAG: MerR family transcriptional regulator [Actinomycetota bacterium]|nr:MerR family transcriptional regulator [Actinomycetota bacterium]